MKIIKEHYTISEEGVVMNLLNNRIITTEANNAGYLRVRLQGKRYFVHRLVATAYVEGYFEGAVVNHKDCNKFNNHYTNLEWVTRSYNSKHAHLNNRQPGAFVESTYKIIDSTGKETFVKGARECAKLLDISRSSMFSKMLRNGGYIDKCSSTVSRCVSNDYCESK